MNYGDFSEKFLAALYYETETNGDQYYTARLLIDRYRLDCKDHWISRITDNWEHSYFKDVSKVLDGYKSWSFRISGQGASYVEGVYTDDEIHELLNQDKKGNYDVDEISKHDIPASNRIVKIDHNQQARFEKSTVEIIEKVEIGNSIDGDVDLRFRVVGQLKAGLEFIRAGVFKSQLVFLSLLDALKTLVNRYEKEAVAALASALIAELMKVL